MVTVVSGDRASVDTRRFSPFSVNSNSKSIPPDTAQSP
jgi:hypothetical protein